MKRNFVVATMAMAAVLVSSAPVYAATSAAGTYGHGMFSKTKTVTFSLRNDSKTEMKVKAGENEITLQPGKEVAVKLAIGDKVVAVDSTPNYPAGTVLAVGGSQLSDSTIVLR